MLATMLDTDGYESDAQLSGEGWQHATEGTDSSTRDLPKGSRKGKRWAPTRRQPKEQRGRPQSGERLPEMDLEPVREELFVAVGARDLVWQAVLAKLILHNGVGGQHHIGLAQLLYACLSLVAVIDHHLYRFS